MILKKYDVESVAEFMSNLIEEIRLKTSPTLEIAVLIRGGLKTKRQYMIVTSNSPNELDSMLTEARRGLDPEVESVKMSDLKEFIDEEVK